MSRRPSWIAARKAIPAKVKAEAWEQADGRCQHCGIPLDPSEAEYDHVTPVALGGSNELENIQVLCFTDHARKTADDVARIAKADRQGGRSGQAKRRKKRGTGQIKSAGFRGWRKMNGEPKWRDT